MIPTLTRVSWTNLSRDRVAQVMAFALPIAFFSIFAAIFGGVAGNSSTHRVTALVVDESHTETSRGLVRALAADSSLHVVTTWAPAGAGAGAALAALTRERATALVREGQAPVAYVLPAGIDTSLSRFDGRGVKVLLLSDPSDPIAPRMAEGLLQAATLSASRDAAAEFGGSAKAMPVEDMMPARVEIREVVGEKRRDNGMVAFYAAGVAVMFLMFGASAGGGVLIEETESGTLERVLSGRMSMTGVLGAKWLYLFSLGVVQIVVMFLWGMVAFRLPLLAHLPGFAVMTLVTAAATSAFGLLLATIARTRQQLQGLANMVVLSFSAIGGSMFPRFLMSATLQKISLVCFNSWALDGFIKVFWRDAPVLALWPQVAVLAGWTVVFLALARRFARRWEAA
jgi:ABC-2 type transport system permease protein